MNVRKLLAMICSVVSLTTLVTAQDQTAFEPRSPVQLVYAEGTVKVDGQEAVIGQYVPYGSVVQCEPESYAELIFGSGNIMRIHENTVAVLNVSRHSRRLDLRTGSVAAVLNGLQRLPSAGSGDRFFLHAGGTVAGVRGTAFFAKIENPSSTYVCTCNGILRHSGEGYAPFDAEHYHHGARRFITDERGNTAVEVAPLLYHDDDDMEGLAARIGETIRWSAGY